MEGEKMKDELLANLICLAESASAGGVAAEDASNEMLIRLLFDSVAMGQALKVAVVACMLEARKVSPGAIAVQMSAMYADSVHRESVRLEKSKGRILAMCDNYKLSKQERLDAIRRALMS